MRLMWQRYGRDFYSDSGTGIDENALPELVLAATGVDASDFIARYAYGTEDVPLAPLLQGQGVLMTWKPSSAAPALDARLRTSNGETHVATVYEGGAAHGAGLSAGDTLVAVNGLRVTDSASLDKLLRAYRPGDEVTVHVFRRDELRVFAVLLAEPQAGECVLARTQANAADGHTA